MSPRYHQVQSTKQPYRKTGLFCLWLVIIAGLSVVALLRLSSAQILSVQSGSMRPLIHKGDAVLIEQVPFTALSMGDVISYRSSVNERLIITHRIQSLNTDNHTLVTKGDYLNQSDPTVNAEQVIGKVRQRIVLVGFALDTLHSMVGLAMVVYVPAAIAVSLELSRLIRYFKPTYELHY